MTKTPNSFYRNHHPKRLLRQLQSRFPKVHQQLQQSYNQHPQKPNQNQRRPLCLPIAQNLTLMPILLKKKSLPILVASLIKSNNKCSSSLLLFNYLKTEIWLKIKNGVLLQNRECPAYQPTTLAAFPAHHKFLSPILLCEFLLKSFFCSHSTRLE